MSSMRDTRLLNLLELMVVENLVDYGATIQPAQ